MKLKLSRRAAIQGLTASAFSFGPLPVLSRPKASAAALDEELRLRTCYLLQEWQRVTITIEEQGKAFVIPPVAGLGRPAVAHALFPQRTGYLVYASMLFSRNVRKKIDEAPFVRLEELDQIVDHVSLHGHNKFAENFDADVPISDCVRGCQISTRHTQQITKPYPPIDKYDLNAKVAFAEEDVGGSEGKQYFAATATLRDEIAWVRQYRLQDPHFSALWEFLHQTLKDRPSRLTDERQGFWLQLDV